MAQRGPSEGWDYSTEGDLDPDLTEEAGYAEWDPPGRRWGGLVLKVILVVVLIAMVAGMLLPLL
ncbi:MAG: hypothetical protein IT299_13580 [Dehalococcoidia bacterium]|nr:hypothetical protein [Dehalococcoidia bacterium]